jgi:hypothetical protein
MHDCLLLHTLMSTYLPPHIPSRTAVPSALETSVPARPAGPLPALHTGRPPLCTPASEAAGPLADASSGWGAARNAGRAARATPSSDRCWPAGVGPAGVGPGRLPCPVGVAPAVAPRRAPSSSGCGPWRRPEASPGCRAGPEPQSSRGGGGQAEPPPQPRPARPSPPGRQDPLDSGPGRASGRARGAIGAGGSWGGSWSSRPDQSHSMTRCWRLQSTAVRGSTIQTATACP